MTKPCLRVFGQMLRARSAKIFFNVSMPQLVLKGLVIRVPALPAGWLIPGWLAGGLVRRVLARLACLSLAWLLAWSEGLLACWLVAWSEGCLAGWLVAGWLAWLRLAR